MSEEQRGLDETTTFWGFLLGVLLGGLLALVYLPARWTERRRVLQAQLLHPTNPLDASIAQGKQLAREQQA